MSAPLLYLDNAATTALDPRVLDVMLPYLTIEHGNPASRHHAFGRRAHDAVETARQQVADALHVDPIEVVFTAGATESNNTVIKGIAAATVGQRPRLVTAITEHPSIVEPIRQLERRSADVSWLGVNPHGQVEFDDLDHALKTPTTLVSIMTANNEVGSLQPIRGFGRRCKEKGVLFHSDATQAVGKIPCDFGPDGPDLISFSGHKLHGPKGIGGLVIRKSVRRSQLFPLLEGGGQERGWRSGTLAVPLIVGLGKAIEIAHADLADEMRRLGEIRDRFEQRIVSQLDAVTVNGQAGPRLPGISNITFRDVRAEALMQALPTLAVSTGSACSTGNLKPSVVLRAMGQSETDALAAVRFSFGRFTTAEHLDHAADLVIDAVRQQRSISPLYQMRQAGHE